MMKNFTIVFFLLLLILTGHDALAQAEPTNYPALFTATTAGSSSINLTWTGSVGATLPSGYLIQIAAGTTPFEPLPADGDVQADEFDLTDDVAVINVAHVAGANSYSFTAPSFSPVQPGTEYRFRIIPYNSGANINYKIDGTPPVSTAFTRSAEPDNHPGTFTGIGTSISQIRLSFPDAATLTNTAGYIILGRTDGVAPTVTGINDGVAPASLTFPAGTTLVATIASGNTFTDHTGLSTASRFDYLIIPFNYDGSNEITYNYKTDGSPRMATAYTLSVEPTNQPATFTATTVSTTQIDLTFPDAATLGNTSGYIIIRRQDGSNPTISGITDGVSPGSLTLPAGTTLVTTVATGITSFNNTGLTAGTVYNYLILPFNYDGSNNGTHNYKTDGTLRTANAATYSLEPSAHTNFFETLAVSATQVNLNFNSIATAGITNGTGYIILRRQDGSDPTAAGVIAGVAPGSLSLPAGTTLVTTINSTSTSTFSNTGLTTGTQYNYAIIPFNWNGSNAGTYNYYTAPTIPTDNATPAAGPVIVSLNPPDDGVAELNLATATITFNVNVAKRNGGPAGDARTFRLYQVGNATPIATIDKDNAGITGFGTATITIPFAATLTPNTQYYIQAGGNILRIAPNSTAWSGISDNSTWNFTAASTVVEPATTLQICYDGNFQTLTDIVIRESSPGDFSPGSDQTYSILLPAGFVFNPAMTTAPSISGSNISAISSLTYLSGNTIVRFSYTITGTSGTPDRITVSGLQVKYTGTSPTTGNMVRIGGSAVQNGNSELAAQNHGTLIADPAAGSTPDFTVQELPGDPTIQPNETRFLVSSRAVKLNGNPTGGSFSGNGTTFSSTNGWLFNVPGLGPGDYPITYQVREATGQQCMTQFQKTLTVYTSVIQNLKEAYCTNEDPSTGLSVPQSQINARFPFNPPGTYIFRDFVFYDPNVFNWVPISNPNNTTFDPSLQPYQLSQSIFGGVYIYYRVTDAATQTQIFFADYQIVRLISPPTVSFNIPRTEFCFDDPAVTLTGLPSPQVPATDNFTGSGVTSPSTNNWLFTPGQVPNANVAQQTFDITYRYRDPVTTCSNLVSRTITVNPRPSALLAGNITPSTSLSVCQDGKPGTFNAPISAGTTYNWYSENPSPVFRTTGNNFAPESYMSTATPATFDFSVTRTINGCESAKLALTVVVNPTPTSPGSSFTRDYCVGENIPNSDFTVTGSNIKWTDAISGVTLTIANPNQPTIQELGITNTASNKYSYIVSQALSGCESPPITVGATVFDLPTVVISTTSELNKICKTGENINLNGIPAQGNWTGTAGFALFNTNTTAGSTQLNPSLLNSDPGTYNLRYTYTDANTCTNSTTVNLQVLPTVQPSVSIGTACDGIPVAFTNNSQLVPSGTGTSITATSWNFGDGSGLRFGSGPVESGTNNSRTTGTYFSPNHRFANVGTFQFTYSMITSDGCVVNAPLQTITINQIPNASFTWKNVCEDTNTIFEATTNNNPPITDAEMNYRWTFASNNNLSYAIVSQSSNGRNATVDYTSTGSDEVILVATSIYNCSDTVQKPVYIVPVYESITEAKSYRQNFNKVDGGWLKGGDNSSWELKRPVGNVIKSDSAAWVTNASGNYNSNEKSWVMSGCFNFKDAKKPLISMDIWADTPGGIDGAVLQYNETGNIENDNDWKVVGTVNAGRNWYEQQGIASKPGNQSQFDLGWSGNAQDGRYTDWKNAVYKLDELIGKQNVVFRIAFASTNSATREGFSFDNVLVGERTRNVLVESFTNTSPAAGADSKNHNDNFKAFENTSGDIVKIQYHTSFPGEDPIHDLNRSMNNARIAQYGITSSPALRIDGQFRTGVPFSWAQTLYDNQILEPAPISITIADPVKENGIVKLRATLRNITPNTVDLNGHNIFFVITEKSITESSLMGSNIHTELVYVARQILPTAAGIPLTDMLGTGDVFTTREILWETNNLETPNANNAAIAVFVQSRTASSLSVMQASVYTSASMPEPDLNLITGIENPVWADGIQLYPNPARESFIIEFPEATAGLVSFEIMDMNGREVHAGQAGAQQRRATIDVTPWANGMYIVQFTQGQSIVRKKMMVMKGQ